MAQPLHGLLDHLPSHQPGAGDIGLHHPVPGLHRVVQIGVLALLLGAVEQDTGVVYQDVDAAEIRHDLPHCLDHVGLLAHVAIIGLDVVAAFGLDAGGFLCSLFIVDIQNGYVTALACQGLYIFVAQADSSAGDQGHLTGEIIFELIHG